MNNDSNHSFIQKILSICSVTSMLSIKGYCANQEKGHPGPQGTCIPDLGVVVAYPAIFVYMEASIGHCLFFFVCPKD